MDCVALIVETPSSPFGHRYLVLPDRVVSDMTAAQVCSALRQPGPAQGTNWIGVAAQVRQTAFSGGRVSTAKAALVGLDLSRITPDTVASIQNELARLLDDLPQVEAEVDWSSGRQSLVVATPSLSKWVNSEWLALPAKSATTTRPRPGALSLALIIAATAVTLVTGGMLYQWLAGRPRESVESQGRLRSGKDKVEQSSAKTRHIPVKNEPDEPAAVKPLPVHPGMPEEAVATATPPSIEPKTSVPKVDTPVLDAPRVLSPPPLRPLNVVLHLKTTTSGFNSLTGLLALEWKRQLPAGQPLESLTDEQLNTLFQALKERYLPNATAHTSPGEVALKQLADDVKALCDNPTDHGVAEFRRLVLGMGSESETLRLTGKWSQLLREIQSSDQQALDQLLEKHAIRLGNDVWLVPMAASMEHQRESIRMLVTQLNARVQSLVRVCSGTMIDVSAEEAPALIAALEGLKLPKDDGAEKLLVAMRPYLKGDFKPADPPQNNQGQFQLELEGQTPRVAGLFIEFLSTPNEFRFSLQDFKVSINSSTAAHVPVVVIFRGLRRPAKESPPAKGASVKVGLGRLRKGIRDPGQIDPRDRKDFPLAVQTLEQSRERIEFFNDVKGRKLGSEDDDGSIKMSASLPVFRLPHSTPD